MKVWKGFAPLKCKIFMWLAQKHRLPTNEQRFWHLLATSASCPLCSEDEDTNHLLVMCANAREIWDYFILIRTDAYCSLHGILASWFNTVAETTVSTAVDWTIWKHRNTKVFNNINEPMLVAARRCIEDVHLWANRCTKDCSCSQLLSWCMTFDPP
jgi:hypothetical protein